MELQDLELWELEVQFIPNSHVMISHSHEN
jgi:hypothetical protein